MPDPNGSQIYSVSQLTGAARRVLEGEFAEVLVRGEVAGLKLAPSGHRYFSLRDAASGVECVLYKQNARFFKSLPAEGMEVIVRAKVTIYEAQGRFQLLIQYLEPAGEGALRLEIEKRRQQLAAEGLFEEARKRTLPAYPRAIGVVTSESGAVWHDIQNVLRRRLGGFHLILAPATVQGESAPAEIIRALHALGNLPEVEVILCGRGGGSLTDLMAFNDAGVVRAIAASPVPVISCVGHETDWTLADLAADLRAPTPSAAAELAAKGAAETTSRLETAGRDLRQLGRSLIMARQQHLDLIVQRRAFADLPWRVSRAKEQFENCRSALRRGAMPLARFQPLLERARRQFTAASLRERTRYAALSLAPLPARMRNAVRHVNKNAAAKSETAAARLQGVSPLKPLERGFALVQTMQGGLVRFSKETHGGQKLSLRFSDGSVKAEIED
jgi:exodeoxyribonuclease VII large subunit